MKIIEPHIHTSSRTTDDLERMAVAGIVAVMEPAFWLGSDRRYAESFFDYFNHILNFETSRVEQFGMKHFCAIGINPKEAENLPLSKAVIAGMSEYLEHERAVAVGEIGLNHITPNEEAVFKMQLEVARDRNLPVVIHLPHFNKVEGLKRVLAAVAETKIPRNLILVDHNTEDTIAAARDAGVWTGMTVYPITKLTPRRAADIVYEFGVERMLVNGSADWGISDPLAVPKVVSLMRREGRADGEIERLVYHNPVEFYGQSGKFRL
jgi:predicted metal-dependent TIM-barrel fold hydrolase